MEHLLRGYSVNQPTWFYLSLLLSLSVFFRFNRFWSLRNLDLALLLSASPGLLLLEVQKDEGPNPIATLGYIWLFVVSGLFLLRLLADVGLQRRPQFGQNMNAPGMAFLCVSAFLFITVQGITKRLPDSTESTVKKADALLKGSTLVPNIGEDSIAGPVPPLIAAPVGLIFEQLAAPMLAILAHGAVIGGLWLAGRRLFGDSQLGWAMATLYLMLPCTAIHVGEFNHVLPSALLVWAVVYHQRPTIAGVLMGLACGTLFFPLFLLPLWLAFYGRKGALRFGGALGLVAIALLGSIALTSSDPHSFIRKTIGTIDYAVLAFQEGNASSGFWSENLSPYRLPIIVAYFVMLVSLTIWPRKKTLEHLLAHSAALIVGTQFWYTQQAGTYLLWYLPLLLMVVFRPRLAHLRSPSEMEADKAADLVGLSRPTGRALTPLEHSHMLR